MSPANAACLAASKFKSLPINNSASNSLVIDSSKSNKLPAAAAIVSTEVPKDFATDTALAKPPGNFCILILVNPVILLASSNTFFKSNLIPNSFSVSTKV